MFTNIMINADWVIGLCKRLFMLIDAIIYQVLAAFYNIFLAIVRVDFSSVNEVFDNVLTRIYLVLSIFMLFMVSFKLLQWLAEPDKAQTESNKLVKNVFLSIVMLIGFPLVFDLLHDVQTAIIDNNIVQTIILGDSASAMDGEMAGPAFSWTLLKAFVHPVNGNDEEIDDWCSSNSSNVCNAYNEIWTCKNPASGDESASDCKFKLMQLAPIVADTNISYTPIISTIVGIVTIFFLITFSLEIGLRTFKLIFMEAIAPIPIISYMNTGKGEATFNKFKDEYIKTYLDLFIRMACVYLVLLLANRLMSMASKGRLVFEIGKDGTQLTGLPLALATVMLVFALFTFAKQIPDLIKKVLNVEGFGGHFDNTVTGAMTRVGLGAAGAVGGAIGGGIGSAAGSLLRGDAIGADGKVTAAGIGKVLGNAGGGLLRGGYTTAKTGFGTKSINMSNAGKVFKGMGIAAGGAITAQAVRSANTTAAGGWWKATTARAYNAAGGGILSQARDVRARNAANRTISGIQGSSAYTSGQTRLDAANKSVESAQSTFDTSNRYANDMQQVKNAMIQSYAARHDGMSFEDAEYAVTNMDSATFNSTFDTYASEDTSVQRAIEEFNSKYAASEDRQIKLTGEGDSASYGFYYADNAATTSRNEAAAELHVATAEQRSAQVTMDNFQKQIDDANKLAENHGIDASTEAGKKKLERVNSMSERSTIVKNKTLDSSQSLGGKDK